MVKETFNAKETFEAGYEMGKKALPGQIYCLNGDLGVGKTVLLNHIEDMAEEKGIHFEHIEIAERDSFKNNISLNLNYSCKLLNPM